MMPNGAFESLAELPHLAQLHLFSVHMDLRQFTDGAMPIFPGVRWFRIGNFAVNPLMAIDVIYDDYFSLMFPKGQIFEWN